MLSGGGSGEGGGGGGDAPTVHGFRPRPHCCHVDNGAASANEAGAVERQRRSKNDAALSIITPRVICGIRAIQFDLNVVLYCCCYF